MGIYLSANYTNSEKTEREEDAAINFKLLEFLLKEFDMGI
jgi:hypothetical protein